MEELTVHVNTHTMMIEPLLGFYSCLLERFPIASFSGKWRSERQEVDGNLLNRVSAIETTDRCMLWLSLRPSLSSLFSVGPRLVSITNCV